jgi:hypothetical protein
MPNSSAGLTQGGGQRCAVCDRRFGLIRYYSWRTPLCSKKCVDRLRVRRENDRNWMDWLSDCLCRNACEQQEGSMPVTISQRVGVTSLVRARSISN